MENVLNREFVLAHELEEREESCFRALIEAHRQRTGSPRAARFLAQRSLHNFIRIQPIHLQESLEGVWRAFLGGVRDPVAVPAPAVLSAPASSAPHYA
jgi:glutamate synthase domain-containing protein 3